MCWPHDWKWEPMKIVGGYYVQYAHCQRCGKTKARDVTIW